MLFGILIYNMGSMTVLSQYLKRVDFQDKQFIGTIALRSEEFTLPDGSKIALGIDDGLWVLIYQTPAAPHIRVYKYDQHENRITVDQKPGKEKELAEFKEHLKYFMDHAKVEELITLLPPQVQK